MSDPKTVIQQLFNRLHWLVKLRWLAAAGVFAVVFGFSQIFHPRYSVLPLYAVALFLVAYNGLIYAALLFFRKISYSSANFLANFQIFIDLTCLAMLIHFSGGVENPFGFYFIFHVIIAGILLSRRAALFQTTYAALLFLGVAWSEYFNLLPYYSLGIASLELHHQPGYLFAVSFVFISTLYISAYMTTSISHLLKDREKGLMKANQQLNEKDRIKSEYVLHVTHDIRDDLSAIQTCLEPVEKEVIGSLNKLQADLLKRAQSRCEQLIRYVNALLDITKLKLTRQLTLEPFSLEIMIESICDSVRPLAESKNISFHVRTDLKEPAVKGVRIYLEEALLNLLKNAVRYTPSGGVMEMNVSSPGNFIRFQIRDNGIGILPEELPHIFEEFYRGRQAKAEEKKGSGLGLSIAKKIVEMHHGKIWAESEPGNGTVFFLDLPILGTGQPPAAAASGPSLSALS